MDAKEAKRLVSTFEVAVERNEDAVLNDTSMLHRKRCRDDLEKARIALLKTLTGEIQMYIVKMVAAIRAIENGLEIDVQDAIVKKLKEEFGDHILIETLIVHEEIAGDKV